MKDKLVRERETTKEMRRIGVERHGIEIMKDKCIFRLIRLTKIKTPLANIIKGSMLSAGGDAAVHKLTCTCKVQTTDILLMGTVAQYKHLLEKLKLQPFCGKDISKRIRKRLGRGA